MTRKTIIGTFNKLTTCSVGVMSSLKDYNSLNALSNNAVNVLQNAKIELNPNNFDNNYHPDKS